MNISDSPKVKRPPWIGKDLPGNINPIKNPKRSNYGKRFYV
jgi:hypothetical protein